MGSSFITYTCNTATSATIRVAATAPLFFSSRDVAGTTTTGQVDGLDVVLAVLFLKLVLARLCFGGLLAVERVARGRTDVAGAASAARDHVVRERGGGDGLGRDGVARAVARARGRADDLLLQSKSGDVSVNGCRQNRVSMRALCLSHCAHPPSPGGDVEQPCALCPALCACMRKPGDPINTHVTRTTSTGGDERVTSVWWPSPRTMFANVIRRDC